MIKTRVRRHGVLLNIIFGKDWSWMNELYCFTAFFSGYICANGHPWLCVIPLLIADFVIWVTHG